MAADSGAAALTWATKLASVVAMAGKLNTEPAIGANLETEGGMDGSRSP